MLDDLDLDSTIKFAIYSLMLHLYDYGIEEIHLGGLMRILGVPNSTAEQYDDDIMLLSDDFAQLVKELTETATHSGQTLH
jgi:hypothetical protein